MAALLPIKPPQAPDPAPKEWEVAKVDVRNTNGARAKVECRRCQHAVVEDANEGVVASQEAFKLAVAVVVESWCPSFEDTCFGVRRAVVM